MNTSISISEISIFLVEPSRMQGRHIHSQLGDLNISNVHIFQDGASALVAMRKQQPNLTISSMYLGDMSGAELVEKMRAEQLLTHIAFILISSEENPLYLDAVRQSGTSAILTKPFELKELRAAIFSTLDYLNQGSLELENDELCIENLRILVVDDSTSARNYLIQVLKNIGFKHFIEACNGKQGAELVQNHTFDLVITDFNMPEMNGDELVEFIRKKSWQTALPVIMITSEQDEARLNSVKSAGVSAICGKPFTPSHIKDLIEQLFASDQ